MRKKMKGSALLWAVCSLLIVAFLMTGLLALNKSYAQAEINNIAGRRAEYLARSGVEFTADLIIKNKLTKKNAADDITRYSEVVVTYDWGTVKVDRTGGDVLRLVSTAEAGDMKRSVTGIMKYDVTQRKWELEGYAEN